MVRKMFLFTVLLIILGGLGATGYGYHKYKNMVDQWYQPLDGKEQEKVTGTQSTKKSLTVETNKDVQLRPFNLLLLGVDTREGENKSRSDTIMLASVNPDTKKVTLLSIPRDTLAEIPGHGADKFNHSMFYGGPSLTKKTMEDFFDIKVDHYITVDFEGFTKVVDSLGGVEVNVKRRMKYHDPMDGTNIDIQPGVQVLDGKNALDYARFRKSDIGSAASDFDRMQRQQEVLKQVSEKASNLTTFFKLFTMMDILRDHVKTDLREDEIRKLAMSFRNFQSSNISSIDINGINKRIPAHGYNMWFYVVDDKERNRVKTIVNHTLTGYSPALKTTR